MSLTQQAYTQRRLDDYLEGFAEDYYSVQLGTMWGEDKQQLREKMIKDMTAFELLKMDFEVLRHWYSGEIGYAHLAYDTRLKRNDDGRVLADRRQNIIVGRHEGEGRWLIVSKIVVQAENFYEKQPDKE